MAHHHAHHHAPTTGSHRPLLLALLLTLGFAFVEAVAGLLSGSLALLGDAGHMLTDSLSLGLAAAAARKSASERTSTFGWKPWFTSTAFAIRETRFDGREARLRKTTFPLWM